MFSIIAAVGKNRELGKDNQLVFHIKEDMQFFKSTTMGHPVLMGLNTFKSIGRPLPGRTNFVATRHPEILPDGVEPVRDLRQFLEKNATSEAEIFVIGGAAIYAAALPYATTLYLTEIAATADADVYFPDFDKTAYARTVIKEGKENDLAFAFVKYRKI